MSTRAIVYHLVVSLVAFVLLATVIFATGCAPTTGTLPRATAPVVRASGAP